MSYERVPLGVDLGALRRDFEAFVRPLPPVPGEEAALSYGGWSVTSETGDYREGWKRVMPSRKPRRFRVPTPLCRDSIAAVVDQVIDLGLWPSRVRFALMRPKDHTIWHTDAPANIYFVRLHIPIYTNPGSLFITEEETVHFPADGDGYLVSVSQYHQAVNLGDTERVHMLMDVWDLEHRSVQYRYRPWVKMLSA
jgi:hypothetical protein